MRHPIGSRRIFDVVEMLFAEVMPAFRINVPIDALLLLARLSVSRALPCGARDKFSGPPRSWTPAHCRGPRRGPPGPGAGARSWLCRFTVCWCRASAWGHALQACGRRRPGCATAAVCFVLARGLMLSSIVRLWTPYGSGDARRVLALLGCSAQLAKVRSLGSQRQNDKAAWQTIKAPARTRSLNARRTRSSGTAPGAAAAPRHAAAPHHAAPRNNKCADGRADAPTPDPTDGHAQTDTEPVASTKELDAVADPLAEADAAADVILFADLRASPATVRVAVGGPRHPTRRPSPRRPRRRRSRFPKALLFYGGRRGSDEDADHFFEFIVCLRLRGRHAAAYDSLWRQPRRSSSSGLRSQPAVLTLLASDDVTFCFLRRPGALGEGAGQTPASRPWCVAARPAWWSCSHDRLPAHCFPRGGRPPRRTPGGTRLRYVRVS